MHITHQISDYVLGLLTPDQQRALLLHAAVCTECRTQLQAEREIGDLVRRSMYSQATASAQHLRQLMPSPPVRQPLPDRVLAWRNPLAVLGVLLMLFLGSLSIPPRAERGYWSISGTTIAETATSAVLTATNEPTATIPALEGQPAGKEWTPGGQPQGKKSSNHAVVTGLPAVRAGAFPDAAAATVTPVAVSAAAN